MRVIGFLAFGFGLIIISQELLLKRERERERERIRCLQIVPLPMVAPLPLPWIIITSFGWARLHSTCEWRGAWLHKHVQGVHLSTNMEYSNVLTRFS